MEFNRPFPKQFLWDSWSTRYKTFFKFSHLREHKFKKNFAETLNSFSFFFFFPLISVTLNKEEDYFFPNKLILTDTFKYIENTNKFDWSLAIN